MPIGSMMMARNSTTNNFTQMECDNSAHLKVVDSTTATSLGGKLDSIITNTANIKASIEVGGDLYVSQDEVEGKLDTINSTLTSGIGGLVLPTALTGSGNLKVSLQELGNEGSERLNVDVGSTVSQLPTALTGEGNLKVSIQEDFTHNLATSAKQDAINNTLTMTLGVPLSAIAGFTNTTNGKLDTINSSIGNVATESTLQIISEEFTKCDTDNVVITGGVVLPSALTGSGNLKVCIQELGNEGSERLNVDVGNAVAQLPTALSGSGRLKIENDISGFATSANQTTINGTLGTINNQFRSQWSNGVGGGTALGPAVALLATEATLTDTKEAVETLEGCVGSNKVNVNISSGGFDGAITNAHLNELGTAINSAKVDVNISSGGFDGAITHTALTELASALNSDKLDVNISSGGFDGAITHSALTELASALNSDKLDVNISSGNISGFATDSNLVAMSAKLPATLGQKANASSMSVCRTTTTGAYDLSGRTTIGTASTSTKLLCNTAGNLVVATTAEDKEVIDDDAISPNTLSIVIDTEHYEKIRLYGNSTTSIGSDLTCFGSNDALGTYYHLPNSDFQANTLTISGGSAIHYLGVSLENTPRFIKIFNKSGGSTYTISKCRMVGSGGRLAV